MLPYFVKSYQFPVLLKALVAVEDVVDPASVSLQWDLPPLLTTGRAMVLTGRKHQVLLPPILVLHHSDRDTGIYISLEYNENKSVYCTWCDICEQKCHHK